MKKQENPQLTIADIAKDVKKMYQEKVTITVKKKVKDSSKTYTTIAHSKIEAVYNNFFQIKNDLGLVFTISYNDIIANFFKIEK